jgi:MAF protein
MAKQFVLASTSKARVEILNDSGIEYALVPNTLDEEQEKVKLKDSQRLTIDEVINYVKRLSMLKGKTIINEVSDSIIVSADSVIYFEGEMLEKPKNIEEARVMLNKLSGNVHKAITGVTLIDTEGQEPINYACITDVKMEKIDDKFLEHLLTLNDTYTHAGGYNIDGELYSKIEILEGYFDNGKGLPLQNILSVLESSLGFIPNKKSK